MFWAVAASVPATSPATSGCRRRTATTIPTGSHKRRFTTWWWSTVAGASHVSRQMPAVAAAATATSSFCSPIRMVVTLERSGGVVIGRAADAKIGRAGDDTPAAAFYVRRVNNRGGTDGRPHERPLLRRGRNRLGRAHARGGDRGHGGREDARAHRRHVDREARPGSRQACDHRDLDRRVHR